MSKGNTFEYDLLNLIFNNVDCALVGDATGLRGSSTAGNLYVSLHTADPAEAGTQTSNEVSYSGYARVAVARTAGGFTVAGGATPSASLTSAIIFAVSAIGDVGTTVTHCGIGCSASGAGKLLYRGAVSPTIALGSSVFPRLGTGTSVTED